MKYIIILFILVSTLFSESIYFSQNALNTVELEAKIISKIATDLLNEPKMCIIGNLKCPEKYISKNIKIYENCEKANFVYLKKGSDIKELKHLDKNKIFFTDDKHKFKETNDFFGAFYWFKSRPNVRISSQKAIELNIKIPDNYSKFVVEK